MKEIHFKNKYWMKTSNGTFILWLIYIFSWVALICELYLFFANNNKFEYGISAVVIFSLVLMMRIGINKNGEYVDADCTIVFEDDYSMIWKFYNMINPEFKSYMSVNYIINTSKVQSIIIDEDKREFSIICQPFMTANGGPEPINYQKENKYCTLTAYDCDPEKMFIQYTDHYKTPKIIRRKE